MNMNIAKLSVLVALFVAGNMSAYQIQVSNDTKRKINVHTDYAGTSGVVVRTLGPQDRVELSPSWHLDCLNRLRIESLGKYESYNFNTQKASGYHPHDKPQDIYTWSGLVCSDQKLTVIETNQGASVEW